jgi:hypothetical protein
MFRILSGSEYTLSACASIPRLPSLPQPLPPAPLLVPLLFCFSFCLSLPLHQPVFHCLVSRSVLPMAQPLSAEYIPQQLDAADNGPTGERGLGCRVLVGAMAGAIAGYGYHRYKRAQRKKNIRCRDGSTREIECDVMVDEHDRELPNQVWDETGRNITPDTPMLSQPPLPGTPEYKGSPAPFSRQYYRQAYPQPYPGYPHHANHLPPPHFHHHHTLRQQLSCSQNSLQPHQLQTQASLPSMAICRSPAHLSMGIAPGPEQTAPYQY